MKQAFILAAVFSVGCAATDAKKDVLHIKYSEYRADVNRENVKTLAPVFFSSNLLKGVDLGDSGTLNQLLFPNYMHTQASHFELVIATRGCLTVNGYDQENMPMTFNIEYRQAGGSWLIEEVDVLLVDHESEFSLVARCPSEYAN